MPVWTTEEEAVVLYYASRQVKNGTIVDLLDKKCNHTLRSVKQVSHKSSRLRKVCGEDKVEKVETDETWPRTIREWDLKRVDQWLFMKIEKAKLQQLLEFDGETAAIIGENHNLDDFVAIMALDDGKTADQSNQPIQLDQPDQPDQQEKHESIEEHNNRLEQ